ncbi:MAG TPA: TraR/DksA family transcriptional regulator [Pirellulaceae bacterium]
MNRTVLIKETKRQLMGRRDALRRALAGDMSMLRSQNEQSVGDEIDAAIATEQAELRSQMASFESRELAQIEAALDKLKQGRYGRCESCDKAIAPMRLKALPYATECINCARSGERGGADSRKHSPINRVASFRGEDESESSHEAYEEIR